MLWRIGSRPRQGGNVCAARFRALVGCALLLGAAGAGAATFTVNSPSDLPDAAPGNAVCETASGNAVCTLRAAVQEANALPGADTIILQANVTYLLTRVGDDDTALDGDLDISDSVTIAGSGAGSPVVDGNGQAVHERVFDIGHCISNLQVNGACTLGTVTVTLSGLTVQHGSDTSGGGIWNRGTLNLLGSTVSNNYGAYAGGGIWNDGSLWMSGSTISDNNAGSGGGIYATGNTTITNSTISGNVSSSGGGIAVSIATVYIINSTIAGNSSLNDGGGIYTYSGVTSLFNTTVADNFANADGSGYATGGGVFRSDGTFTFKNSIIALNRFAIEYYPYVYIDYDDCSGTITSQGNSILYSVHAYCTAQGNPTIGDPKLATLQDNGGATWTIALSPGSPAIDMGNAGGCTDPIGAPLTSDQRGFPRPVGAYCDIGAFEAPPDSIFKDGFGP